MTLFEFMVVLCALFTGLNFVIGLIQLALLLKRNGSAGAKDSLYWEVRIGAIVEKALEPVVEALNRAWPPVK